MSIDDDYVYFGEDGEEANVNDVHDDQNIREVRTNSKGIKVRGKDLEWIPASSFGSDTLYKESQIYNELKESYTLKRKSEAQSGVVENYVCRFSRRAGYVKCPKQFRVIFPDDSFDVHIEETNCPHNHAENPDSLPTTGIYHWSHRATEIIKEGVTNNLKPTVILRNLRTQNALSDPEPSRVQLNNKISHVKRKGNMSEHCETTQSLRNKLSEFRELPVSDDESWVPLCQIDDSHT